MIHDPRRINGYANDRMTEYEIERLLYHMPTVAERATDLKVRTFASQMAQRRKFRNWRPTPKQFAWMQRLVAELFQPHEAAEVIDAAD